VQSLFEEANIMLFIFFSMLALSFTSIIHNTRAEGVFPSHDKVLSEYNDKVLGLGIRDVGENCRIEVLIQLLSFDSSRFNPSAETTTYKFIVHDLTFTGACGSNFALRFGYKGWCKVTVGLTDQSACYRIKESTYVINEVHSNVIEDMTSQVTRFMQGFNEINGLFCLA